MAKRLKISPTKSALLSIKKQVAFLEQGYVLLERKKELLTRLVYERLAVYRRLRGEARKTVETAYYWLSIAHMRMGGHSLRKACVGLRPALQASILPRSSIGVQYPAISIEILPLEAVGLMGTDASFDEARQAFAEMAKMLAELGESETALWRLLEEQRKTQKRVNALKYNVIPRYRATIHFIQSSLEEEERNTLFQIKVLRQQQGENSEL